jgi:two-component system probable response regulator PhcQ
MRRILLLDDEMNVLLALQRSMRAHLKIPDLRVEIFTNPYQALERVCACDFDLAISDYRMPQMSGVAFLQALKDVAPNTVRMMLSASTEFETAMSAINDAHVFRFIPKPWNLADLEDNIGEALALRDRLMAEQGLSARPGPPPTPQELEARRLEAEEPGLLKVNWGPDGSIIL